MTDFPHEERVPKSPPGFLVGLMGRRQTHRDSQRRPADAGNAWPHPAGAGLCPWSSRGVATTTRPGDWCKPGAMRDRPLGQAQANPQKHAALAAFFEMDISKFFVPRVPS